MRRCFRGWGMTALHFDSVTSLILPMESPRFSTLLIVGVSMTWHWMHRRTCAKTEGSTCRQITFPKHRRRNHFLGEMRSAPGSWGGTSWGKLYYRLILQKRTNKYQTEVDDKNLKQIHGAFYCFADLLQNKNWATDVAIWVSPILRIIMTSSLKGALSAVLIRHKSAWAVDVGLGYESDSPRSGKKAASCGK